MRSAMLVAACSFIAAATTAQAQTIAGTVRDTTGALMPGVTVEAASPALIEKLRSVVTDGTGQYKKFANVKIGIGDAVLIRTGRWALRAAKGPWNSAREAAGLHVSVMPWLKQRDVSLLGSDAVNDVQPSGVAGGSGEAANRPVHTLSIAIMGMPLVDNGYFEDAAQEAARLKRWDFFMTVQLTKITGGTATPFNALGVF